SADCAEVRHLLCESEVEARAEKNSVSTLFFRGARSPRPREVTVRSLWLLTLTLVARVSLAQSAPIVDPRLPFTIDELEQALAPRVAASSIASLIVTAEGEGEARISPAGMTRVVALGNRTGYPAARVVALVIYDLLLVEPTLPVLARLDDRARPADRLAVQLTALGGVARGLGAAEPPGLTLSVALTTALGDRLRGRISVSKW